MSNIKELTPLNENTRQYKISNIGNILHNMSCSMDDEDEQSEFGCHASFLRDLADYFRDQSNINTSQPKPVYTQAMKDNGVMPLVGMEVLIRGYKRVILLGADSDGDYITTNKDGSYDFDSINQFEPIDTRTDTEKAIYDIRELFETWMDYPDVLESIKAGKIHGVTFTGEE